VTWITPGRIDPALDALVEHRRVQVGELRLHVVTAGEGPAILLLHGVPDFWYGWRFQIEALVAAGWSVVVPDLRGIGGSDRMHEIEDFALDRVLGDVLGLLDGLGIERAAGVIAHDWGAQIAWLLAMENPERLRRLAVIASPHPARIPGMRRDPRQALRLAWTRGLKTGLVPEFALRAGGHRALRSVIRRTSSRLGAVTDGDLDLYVDALGHPESTKAALDAWRSFLDVGPTLLKDRMRPTPVPTLVVHGDRDPLVRARHVVPGDAWVPTCQASLIDGAGHWPHWDDPDAVNPLLVGWIRAGLEDAWDPVEERP
jgi:epoxide hydrolase 4